MTEASVDAQKESWKGQWHPRTPSAPKESVGVGISDRQADALETLLSHYSDLIVYMGFVFWRKMLVHLPAETQYSDQVAETKALNSDSASKITPSSPTHLAVLGDLQKFSSRILPSVFLQERRPLTLAAVVGEQPVYSAEGEPAGAALTSVIVQTFLRQLILCDQCDCVALVVRDLQLDLGDDLSSNQEERTALHFAARVRSSLVMVRFLVRQGAKVDALNSGEHTPLHAAALYGSDDLVMFLVAEGAKATHRSKKGVTILHNAAESGSFPVVELLLSKGADIKAVDSFENTPLLRVALKGNIPMFEFLLDRGADLRDRDKLGQNALFKAASAGRIGMMDHLVSVHRFDVNAEDKDSANRKETPLARAAMGGHGEAVRWLLGKGADIEVRDGSGFTPLISAAWNGRLEAVTTLIACGAKVDARNDNEETPLMKAAYSCHPEVVKVLLSHGADVEASDKDGDSVFSWVLRRGEEAMDETAEVLLAHGVNINGNVPFWSSYVHQAAYCGDMYELQFLLRHGVNANATNDHGETPLHLAARAGTVETLKLLLPHPGILLNAEDDMKQPPLEHAAADGQTEVVQLLLEQPAIVEGRNDGVLSRAVRGRHLETARVIAQSGHIAMNTFRHAAVLRFALEQLDAPVVDLLLNNGVDPNMLEEPPVLHTLAAVRDGGPVKVELLLALVSNRANVHAKDPQGRTALQVATELEVRNSEFERLLGMRMGEMV